MSTGTQSIQLKVNVDDFMRRTHKLNAVEIPNAIQKALWKTADRARNRLRLVALSAFDKSPRTRRKAFVANSIRSKGGRMTPQGTSMVHVPPTSVIGRKRILHDHRAGVTIHPAAMGKVIAQRLTRNGRTALPAKGIKRGAKGEVDFNKYTTKAERKNNGFFLKVPKGQLWAVRTQRKQALKTRPRKSRKTGKVRFGATKTHDVVFLLYLPDRVPKLEPRFPFYQQARATGERFIYPEMVRAFDRAVEKKIYGTNF